MTPPAGEFAHDDVFQHEPEARPSYAEAVAFFGHLVYRVPPLRDTLAAHLLETRGEILPHLLAHHVLEWLLDRVARGVEPETRLALDVLDAGYRDGSDTLRELLIVSFLEALPGFAGDRHDPGGRGAALRVALGPTLTRVLLELEQHRRNGARPQG